MALKSRYQDFSEFLPSANYGEEKEDEVEEAKLQAFENGYQAGWDDADKAHQGDQSRIAGDFAQNLQDISFSYHEALAKLTLSIKPLMAEIVDKLLPAMSQASLGAHVQEQLAALVAERAAGPIEIVVAPDNQDALVALLEGADVKDFAVVTESTLGHSQVFLRVGQTELEVDLGAVVEGIRDAISAFFQQNK